MNKAKHKCALCFLQACGPDSARMKLKDSLAQNLDHVDSLGLAAAAQSPICVKASAARISLLMCLYCSSKQGANALTSSSLHDCIA